MSMKKSDVMVGRSSFIRLVSDLRRRGFEDEKKAASRAPVIRDGYPIATLAREIAGFKLTVEGLETIESIQGDGILDPERPVKMKVRYDSSANSNLEMMLKVYGGKSHYLAQGKYIAAMVPDTDPGAIIRNGLSLEDAVVKADDSLSEALSAREILERVGGSLDTLSTDNRLKELARNYMDGLLTSLKSIYDNALARISQEPALRQAMDTVADRE
jgi:hypothetical protein